MKKYRVSVPYVVWMYIDVDAVDEEAAEEAAWDFAGLQSYCGNGGSGKLVGTSLENVNIEACEESLDLPEHGLVVEVNEVKQ